MALLARAGMVPNAAAPCGRLRRPRLTAPRRRRRRTSPSWHDIAAAAGITHTGVAPAAPLLRARRELRRRAAAGLADDMAFTYRNPERSTDPQAAVAGAQAIFVGALPYGAADARRGRPGVTGRVARYAWDDHTDRLRDGLWDVARRLRADGWKAVAFADDNSIVDREVAYLAGIGWFGKNANLLLPGAGSWFVLGCVVTTAPLPVAHAPCRRRLRRVPAVPRRAARRGRSSRRAWSTPAAAWRGCCRSRASIDRRWREAIGDRLYGCDDCQDGVPADGAARPPARQLHVEPSSGVRRRRSTCSTPPTTRCSQRWGRWYLADRDPRWVRRNALVVLGNTPAASRRLPDAVGRCCAHYARATRDEHVLREHGRSWAASSPP